MTTIASAPGKVAIVGEYAVLEGAPALVIAVNRRALVTLTDSDRSVCSVAAPGWQESAARFELTDGGPVWLDGGGRVFTLAAHVLGAFFRCGEACPPFDLVLNSTSLMERGPDGPVKLGLGSSAALTVALWRGLRYHAASQHDGNDIPDLDGLIRIHSGFQGGVGSGLDVAASLHGGVIEFSRCPGPRVRPSRLPDGIHCCFVWSGEKAATGGFLARIQHWRGTDAGRYARVIAPLVEIAENAARAARSNDGDAFLRLLDVYTGALQDLGNASGTDILSEPHRRLREIARRHGVVYKPCGAGGGDIGVGLARHAEALARFRSGLTAERFLPLSLNIDPGGAEARSGN